MSKRIINPKSIAPPVGAYSHAVLAPGVGRWLHLSGQIGMSPDGATPEGFTAQATAAWSNMRAILDDAQMSIGDLIKVTTFLIDANDLPALGPVRSSFLGEHRPASTLLVVAALARPEWRIEIEAIAWRAD